MDATEFADLPPSQFDETWARLSSNDRVTLAKDLSVLAQGVAFAAIRLSARRGLRRTICRHARLRAIPQSRNKTRRANACPIASGTWLYLPQSHLLEEGT